MKQSGYVNWLGVGSMLGQQFLTRIYDQDAAPILAILIGLNAVTAPDHWRKAHHCTPEMDKLLTPLSHEFHKRGKIRWTDTLGIELISRLEAACRRTDLGWVDPGALARLVKALTGQEAEKTDHARPGKERPANIPNEDKPFRKLTMPFKNPNK